MDAGGEPAGWCTQPAPPQITAAWQHLVGAVLPTAKPSARLPCQWQEDQQALLRSLLQGIRAAASNLPAASARQPRQRAAQPPAAQPPDGGVDVVRDQLGGGGPSWQRPAARSTPAPPSAYNQSAAPAEPPQQRHIAGVNTTQEQTAAPQAVQQEPVTPNAASSPAPDIAAPDTTVDAMELNEAPDMEDVLGDSSPSPPSSPLNVPLTTARSPPQQRRAAAGQQDPQRRSRGRHGSGDAHASDATLLGAGASRGQQRPTPLVAQPTQSPTSAAQRSRQQADPLTDDDAGAAAPGPQLPKPIVSRAATQRVHLPLLSLACSSVPVSAAHNLPVCAGSGQ